MKGVEKYFCGILWFWFLGQRFILSLKNHLYTVYQSFCWCNWSKNPDKRNNGTILVMILPVVSTAPHLPQLQATPRLPPRLRQLLLQLCQMVTSWWHLRATSHQPQTINLLQVGDIPEANASSGPLLLILKWKAILWLHFDVRTERTVYQISLLS